MYESVFLKSPINLQLFAGSGAVVRAWLSGRVPTSFGGGGVGLAVSPGHHALLAGTLQ